ncbi:Nesprin-1, partial [Schistosoma japonicum]
FPQEFQTELNQNTQHFDNYRDALSNIQSLGSTIDCLYDAFKQFEVDAIDKLKLSECSLIHKLNEELTQFQMNWEQLQIEVNNTHNTIHQQLEQMEQFDCKQLSLRKLLTEIEQKAYLGPHSTNSSVVDFTELEKEVMNYLNDQCIDGISDNHQNKEKHVVIFEKLMNAQQSIVDWWEMFVQQLEEEVPKAKDELKTISSIPFPTPTGLLNQLLRIEEILSKSREFLIINKEGLSILSDWIKSWENWQHWWVVDSGADDILQNHGGPSNYVNQISVFNTDGYLDTKKCIDLQIKLDQLDKLKESEGKLKLIDLVEQSNSLQLINDQQRNPMAFIILSSQQQITPLNEQTTSPVQHPRQLSLTLSIAFIQKLIRYANHQYSSVFDDLPMAIDRLNSKLCVINEFLGEFKQLSNILVDTESSVEKLESFLTYCSDNQMDDCKHNSLQKLQFLLNIDFNEMTSHYLEANYCEISTSDDVNLTEWDETMFIDFLNQLSASVKLLTKVVQSNSEKLYSLETSACMLGVFITQTRKQIATEAIPLNGRNQVKLMELDIITSHHSELVKRVQSIVERTDSCMGLLNKLMYSFSSVSEWINQLEQTVSNYANLSGDRHTLQARLELVKKRLN